MREMEGGGREVGRFNEGDGVAGAIAIFADRGLLSRKLAK